MSTFLCGVVSVFLFQGLGALDGDPSVAAILILGSATFLLVGTVGCLLLPPFRAALIAVAGVFVGITLHIIIFPTVNGFERNLFPLEMAGFTLWAAVCCFALALLWSIVVSQRA